MTRRGRVEGRREKEKRRLAAEEQKQKAQADAALKLVIEGFEKVPHASKKISTRGQ